MARPCARYACKIQTTRLDNSNVDNIGGNCPGYKRGIHGNYTAYLKVNKLYFGIGVYIDCAVLLLTLREDSLILPSAV